MTKDKEILLKVLDRKSKLPNNNNSNKKCKHNNKIHVTDITAIVSTLNTYIMEENKIDNLCNNYRKAKSKHKIEAYSNCIKLLNELLQKVDK